MASSEVFWQSAFWSLPPLAINTMMQPSGRVCGFDPLLRTYLRSSPIVCTFDAVTIIIRFIAYICLGLSPAIAAKKVIATRYDGVRDTRPGGLQTLEQVPFLRCLWFLIGVIPQAIKLMACSGLPWTQTWGCFYLAPFVVVEVMNTLAAFAVEELDTSGDNSLERWLGLCEKSCGAVAVLLQLALLAFVDLAVIPPTPNFTRRWKYRIVRLFAHFIVFLIYIPLTVLQSDEPTPSPPRRLGGLVLSMLLVYVTLAGFAGMHFSQMYFMSSIIISSFAWLLFFFPVSRTHVLLCDLENRGYRNVLAFDFFCRILCFSLFWYVWHYDPAGTFKPKWAEVLG